MPTHPSDAGVDVESGSPAVSPVAPFPPPSFSPMFARTAGTGDGAWSPVPEAGTVDGKAVMFRTSAHPRKFKRMTEVVIVAVDLNRVDLVLVPGTTEPKAPGVAPEHRSGLVPIKDQPLLSAVFNGGFQTKHGHYGMRVGSDLFGKPRADACTVALYQDRSVGIGTWAAIASTEGKMAAYRQTPPCLVENGTINPDLRSEWKRRKWGGAVDGKKEVRRTALGVDETSKVLFFAIGEEIRADDLAASVKAAGAVNVAQLDINWSYTRFLFFGTPAPGKPLQVTSTLIPKLKHAKRGYVSVPSSRDFFYLRRRAVQ